ncbi:extracellular solute-binding protein, partial [Streptomyces hydrogenans]
MRAVLLRRCRHASAATLLVLMLTACAAGEGGDGARSEDSSDPTTLLDPKAKVTITIDCMPPAAKAAELKEWKEDVAEFNRTYPNVTIEGRSTPGQCLEPPRFTAMLKAKSQPDVFYTYFTDLPQVLAEDGAQDISA